MIRLRLLGGASLERDGIAIAGKATQRRRLALLAILAVTRGTIGREKLLVLLWPEQDTAGGRRLLSEALHVLRKELGDGAFRTAGDEVGLTLDVLSCDLWHYEDAVRAGQLAIAAASYGGPLLDGFYVSGAEGFEKWLDAERDRLHRSYALTLEGLALECEADKRYEAAAEWWVKLLRVDPASTRYAHRLMCALEAVGDVASAIRHATAHTAALREEIGADPPPEFVRELERLRRSPNTVRLGATHEEEAAGAPREPAIATPVATLVPIHEDSVPNVLPRRKVTTSRLGVFAVFGAAVLLTVALVVNAAISEGRTPPLDPRRVAILYFEDLSVDKALGHLTEGLTETLIHELGLVNGLTVIPKSGVRQYRGSSAPSHEIATALRAGTLVTGSLQVSSGRLRVMVQLLDGHTTTQVQGRVLERPLGELFSLEDDIAREVAGFLRRRLGEEIRVREDVAGTRNARARDLYLRAEQVRALATSSASVHHQLDTRGSMALLETADSLLLKATSLDNRWALPLISRGWVAVHRASLVPAAQAVALFNQAFRLADSALANGKDRAPALELRGTARWRFVHSGYSPDNRVSDSLLAAAAADLQDAVAVEPRLARSWSTLSQLLRLRGDLVAADMAAERALQEDEFIDESALIMERLYRSSFALARYEKARGWCERGHLQFSNDWRFVECSLTLLGYDAGEPPSVELAWRLHDELAQLDPSGAAIESARPYSPIYRRMAVARVLARAGLSDSARAMIARAREDVGSKADLRSSLLYDEAYVRLLLGEPSAAITLLEEYVRMKPHLRTYVGRDVQFRRLRGDPRFDAISQIP